MTPAEELNLALSGRYRAIVIAEKPVDISPTNQGNRLFLMKVAEGSMAAGGRGGGFGERRVVRVSAFEVKGSDLERTFETEDDSVLGRFEIPYYVSRIPVVLSDHSEAMGYGVIDPALLEEFERRVP